MADTIDIFSDAKIGQDARQHPNRPVGGSLCFQKVLCEVVVENSGDCSAKFRRVATVRNNAWGYRGYMADIPA